MLHFVAFCGMIFGNDVDGFRKRVDTMEYAHRMTTEERERHDALRKAGRLGSFSRKLSQDELDAYADMVGRTETGMTMQEIREFGKGYDNGMQKTLHK